MSKSLITPLIFLAVTAGLTMPPTAAEAQNRDRKVQPRSIKQVPVSPPSRTTARPQSKIKPGGLIGSSKTAASQIKFQTAPAGLTQARLESQRRRSNAAPIYGTSKSSQTDYMIVLSARANLVTGPKNARRRGLQIKQVANSIAQRTRLSAAVRNSLETSHGALNMMTVKGPSADELMRLSQDPRVLFIEQVSVQDISGVDSNPQSWGLDRIDQQALPTDNEFEYTDNSGANIWIIDTGVRDTHNEFGSRVVSQVNYRGGPDEDCNGHGTHVAGTAAGQTFGVARYANIHSVKVLDCGGGGASNYTISGINHVYNNATGLSVANMSLGGSYWPATNLAVANLSASGVPVIVAAGNNRGMACAKSPASEPSAITVAASDQIDKHAFWSSTTGSNGGSCVDLYAPGSAIKSAWITSDTATSTLNGTSMAAPHVAGIAAALLMENPSFSAQQIHDEVVNTATSGAMVYSPSTANKLAYYKPKVVGPNQAPIPMASINWGSPYSGKTGVTLDASASSDPDGHYPLTYEWIESPAGSFTIPDVVNPTFTVPTVSTKTQFNIDLKVTDALGKVSTQQMHFGLPVSPDHCTPYDEAKTLSDFPIVIQGVNTVSSVKMNKPKVQATLAQYISNAQSENSGVSGATLVATLSDRGTAAMPTGGQNIAGAIPHTVKLEYGSLSVSNANGIATDFWDGGPLKLDTWYRFQTETKTIHNSGGMERQCGVKKLHFRIPRVSNSSLLRKTRPVEIFRFQNFSRTTIQIPTNTLSPFDRVGSHSRTAVKAMKFE